MSRIRCKKCGTELRSRHRHDLRSCPCGVFVDGGSDYCRVGYPGGNPDDWIEHLPLTWRSARDGIDRALPEIDDDYLIAIIGWMRYTATLIPPFTRPPEEIWTGAGGLGYNHLIEEAKLRGLDCG